MLLVEAHGFTPLGAAALVSLLPVSALIVRRALPAAPAATGIIVLAAGLGLLALAPESVPSTGSHSRPGAGLGACLPATSERAGLAGVASRHAGVVLGLLLVAPLLSDDLSHNAETAKTKGITTVIKAPVPFLDKIPLTYDLYQRLRKAGHGNLPDFKGAFDKARSRDRGATAKLDALERSLNTIQRDAIAESFKRPFGVAAILALLALLPLGGRRIVAVARLPA